MAQLCEAGKITANSAEKVACKIAQENITITEVIITRFIERVTKKGGLDGTECQKNYIR